jgi:hypothetical protein
VTAASRDSAHTVAGIKYRYWWAKAVGRVKIRSRFEENGNTNVTDNKGKKIHSEYGK